ncbi:MAG: response regulator [Gammaproteobacteria bacterium]|jgi:DNA-binding NtrC family response regulator|nr:response regulator [Gammaproteobacteria bacterium]
MSSISAVLIVEDEPILAKNMRRYLQSAGFEVVVAGTGETAMTALESARPDIVLLDYRLPDTNGLELIARIHAIDRRTPIIMITGEGNVQLAVQAMKAGAHDYLAKPVVLKELKLMLEKIVEQARVEGALDYFHQKQAGDSGLDKLLGDSQVMLDLKQQILQLIEAEHNMVDGIPASVLITGETGSGKELVARALHFDGARREGPFIEINCSAIPAHLLEAELFGYERGAFTDARERKKGLVEAADGGTLFLDEIGDMDVALQTKLLKLLEDRTVRRLGGLRDQQVKVRIVAATNSNLEQLIADGKFRSDLYYRLRVVQLNLPPLRERNGDILMLANYILNQHAQRYRKQPIRISEAAQAALMNYAWPGNVRELRNMMEQVVLMTNTEMLEPHHLPLSNSLPPETGALPGSDARVQPATSLTADELNLIEMEKRMVAEALERTQGNVTRAAELLGLSRDTLRYRIEKHRICIAS